MPFILVVLCPKYLRMKSMESISAIMAGLEGVDPRMQQFIQAETERQRFQVEKGSCGNINVCQY